MLDGMRGESSESPAVRELRGDGWSPCDAYNQGPIAGMAAMPMVGMQRLCCPCQTLTYHFSSMKCLPFPMPTAGGFHCLCLAAVLSLVPAFSGAAEIEPGARELAKASAAKLAAAQTVKVTATHKLSPGFTVGARVENGPVHITVKRPNQFHAIQKGRLGTCEISYDGKSICVMHPEPKHHSLEPLKAGSIEQFSDRLDERFGFRPPVAELLANDLEAQLFVNATAARVVGREWCGWTRCERLRIVQDGMTGDLWIGVKDRLPRRLLLTFTGFEGQPTWDIKLTNWQLNPAVDESLFSKRPAADSQRLKMLKSR